MSSPRVAIGFDSEAARDALFSRWKCSDFEVDCFDDGRALADHCQTHQPELVVLALSGGASSPARDWPPLAGMSLLVMAAGDADVTHALRLGMVAGLIVGPPSAQAFHEIIHSALQRCEQIRQLQVDLAKARQAVEDRKLIERAKGVLMRNARLDEAEAFQRMRNAARNSRSPLAEIARSILSTGDFAGSFETS